MSIECPLAGESALLLDGLSSEPEKKICVYSNSGVCLVIISLYGYVCYLLKSKHEYTEVSLILV